MAELCAAAFSILGRLRGHISSTGLTHTYGQLYLAYAPTRNTVTSGLWMSSSWLAGLAGGNALPFLHTPAMASYRVTGGVMWR